MKATASRYRANVERLSQAQKSSAGTAAYSRHVNRPVARRLAAAASLWGMSPNGASVVSACLTGSAVVLVMAVEPSWPMSLGAAVLLAAGYVMDSVDGQLARLSGSGSLSGEWLDHTIDCFKASLVHIAVLVSWYRFPPAEDRTVLALPLAYLVVQNVTYFGLILMPLLRSKGRQRSAEPAHGSEPSSGEHPLRQWLLLPTDYGVFAWSLSLLAWPVAFLGIYGLFTVINAAALLWALQKWWQELRALDATGQLAQTHGG